MMRSDKKRIFLYNLSFLFLRIRPFLYFWS